MYSKYLWPVVRLVVKTSRRCQRCILSEKYSPLKNGLCEECSQLTLTKSEETYEVSEHTKNRFHQTIKSYIANTPYHALLLLSGGKDSAYILHKMRQDYPELNILCAIVNNGFMSPVAIDGAKYVAEKLKTDLLVVNARIDEFAKVLRQAFLDLRGRGSYGVVDHADGELIFKTGQQVAKEMKIPLLIGGLSWVQVQRIVGKDDFELTEDDGPHMVFPLAVWRTNEQEIRATIRALELLPPGSDSPIVSNSSLILAMSVIDVLNNGYCSFEPEFAQLVREGKTDRKTWLHLFELLEFGTRKGFLTKDLRESLNKLNLSLTDVVKEKR